MRLALDARDMSKRSAEGAVPASWYAAARLAAKARDPSWSQRRVAKELDLAVTTVSGREAGRIPVHREAWEAILAVLGLPRDWRPADDPPPDPRDQGETGKL